jgi:phosphate transport system substrate-binding protein
VVDGGGFVAQTIRSATPPPTQNAPEEYQRIISGAERLSVNFRFSKGGRELDNKARLDLDRVVNYITDQKFSGQNILLLGFADDESSGNANLELSRQRALMVAGQFQRRGLTPAVVTGFGSQIPVASETTDEGREKNRRVELWLKRQ